MRGKRARAIRHAAMPPDVRRAMKSEIAAKAAKRAELMGAAKAIRNQTVAGANTAYKVTCYNAWRNFEDERNEIVEKYNKAVVEALA